MKGENLGEFEVLEWDVSIEIIGSHTEDIVRLGKLRETYDPDEVVFDKDGERIRGDVVTETVTVDLEKYQILFRGVIGISVDHPARRFELRERWNVEERRHERTITLFAAKTSD